MAQSTLQVGDITAVVGDNAAHGEHAAGYNGLFQLTHKAEPTSLFVPRYAGMNLEHVFDGDRELRGRNDRNIFFEPRYAPMELKNTGDTVVELHQPPTPYTKLESWSRFELKPPHYVDFTFRCRPTQHVFRFDYIGLFWASYINAPEDKSIYFRNEGRWHQLCTAQHNNQSTVTHRDDRFKLKFSDLPADTLYRNLSPLRFDEPFYYGLFGDMIFILMFDQQEGIRFTHSPSGGGYNARKQTTNPAWDFQFIVPEIEVLKEYGFRARAAYRLRCSREEVLREFREWRGSL